MPSFTQTLLAGLLAIGVMAVPNANSALRSPPATGSDSVPEELIAAYQYFTAAEAESSSLGRRGERSVDLYLHVIQHPTNRENDPSNETLAEQVKVLNDAFLDSHFQFILQNISRTVNEVWYNAESIYDKYDMRRGLRQGGKDALNLFIFDLLQPAKEVLFGTSSQACILDPNGTKTCNPVQTTLTHKTIPGVDDLGSCRFPGKWLDDPYQLPLDGCDIDLRALPGGSFTVNNQGNTAVHETGHWLGLTHPFPNHRPFPDEAWRDDEEYPKICDPGVSNLVVDTPVCYLDWNLLGPEGCPENDIDTCPNHWGKDPIHNYMHYTSDKCLTEFTPGQAVRMHQMYNYFRSTGN
ncbi:Metallopeptidase, catalytic domain protein [Metarhizium rileyi]|uniref:Metallopeptidase, catalytic domain protein n=1 Tax=Metarhizium rileyi (strain RCEF 4871) TaxID=1649241 RepID=A0A162JHE6_METRR|nr:Metallopeptidase, catalytic domain protein [Metarhizium rileyi RCEF 4871]